MVVYQQPKRFTHYKVLGGHNVQCVK